ncbi:unnamed protein product [Malus baccata var. baccata]
MVVGEIFLAALLQLLIDRLEPREIRSYFGRWQPVLNDAEEKQLKGKAVELWLDDLTDLGNEQNGAGTSKVQSLIPKVKLFVLNMNSGIEDISHRLQAISEQKDMLDWKRPSSSYELSGKPVVGRDNDKTRIIELLSRDERPVKFEVVAIVGIPGVGKTTLAQLVLDENIGAMDQFNPKIWEYVSDEFNLFLLILDDVWNTFDYELWERLQLSFCSGAPGSKIIVTTCDAKVARTMGATEVYDLQCISQDNCWKIFGQHAFKVSNDILPNFGLLQDKVVARCSELPLAARSLGGLLGSKEYEEWEEILNNESWSLSDEESDILPVLKLSYYYLPSSLKRRFAYCSIFPNGYKFGETQLILLWMAEGLLKQPKERKDMEDTGADYFGELLSRQLFQKSSKDNLVFVMHDLVVD